MLADGTRDILGIWIENTEGAKFWMKVFNDMKTRGCNDVLIAVTWARDEQISKASSTGTKVSPCKERRIRSITEPGKWDKLPSVRLHTLVPSR